MDKRQFALLIGFCLLLNFPGLAREPLHVAKIAFKGNQIFSSEELLNSISTRPPGGFQKIFSSGEIVLFNEKLLREDIENLVRLYQKEGFLFVQITPQITVDSLENRVDILIRIEEGPPITVNRIQFHFSGTNLSQETPEQLISEIESALELRPGKRFRDVDLIHDQMEILRHLNNSGYPYAKIDPELHVRPEDYVVDIGWNIESGPPCVFGDITLTGNEKAPASLILKQLAFKSGETFRQISLDQSQQQIFALGLFQAVTVKALLTPEQETSIPVVVQVHEAPRLTARTGLGYGKEDKFRIFASLVHLGSLGSARRTNLLIKHSDLEPYNINLKLIQPVFFSYRTAAALNPFWRKEKEPGYTVTRLGGKVSLMRQFSPHLRGSINYLYERIDRSDAGTILDSLPPKTGDDLYNKAGPILGLTYDSSGPIFDPDQGIFLFLNLKINGLVAKSEYRYLKWSFDSRRYHRLGQMVLAYRLMIGGIVSWNETGYIPVEDRFFSGGITSVRGWGRQQLGPKDENGTPLGGKSILEGNLELRAKPFWKFSSAVFLDLGNVWLDSNHYPLNEIRYSAGVGVGIETPIGPVRLDFAWPIFDVKKSMEWHLNVGQSF